jgi:membrane-associated phospholipid phosphatase
VGFLTAPTVRQNRVARALRRAPFFRTSWNETYGWHVAAYLAVLSASVFAFAGLAQAVADDEAIAHWDVRLNRWVHHHSSPALTRFFELFTTAGGFVFLLLVAVGAAALLLRRRAIAEAALVTLAFVGGQVLNGTMKVAFERPRPAFRDPQLNLHTFSFPSGHAMVSTTVYGALTIVVLRRLRSGKARAAVIAAAALLVGLIGFSRIYLGAHYVTDVLAGVTLGLAWLSLCVLAITILERRRRAGTRMLKAEY